MSGFYLSGKGMAWASQSKSDAPNEGKCLPLPDGQVLLLALSMLFPYGNRGSSSPEKNRGKRPNFGP